MNIVIIARIYIDEYMGGSVKYYTDLAESFVRLEGCSVHIISGTKFEEKAGSHCFNGVQVHKIFLPFHNSLLNYLYRNWMYTRKLKQIHHNSPVDLVNIQEGGFLLFIKKDRGLKLIPCIYTVHAAVHYEILYDYLKLKNKLNIISRIIKYPKMKLQYYKFKFAEESDMKYSKRIILMSDYVRGHIKKFYRSNFEVKIRKFPIGIIDAYFHQIQSPKGFVDETVFFTLRRLEPRMGIDKLLFAIKIISKKLGSLNVHFIIGGQGSLQKELRELAQKLEIENLVSFVGFLSEDEKLKYYNRANAFILPTQELEGFGIVIIEAWAANVPVIATNAGAIPELLNPISPELLAMGTGENEIAEKIEYFIKNRLLYLKSTKFRDYAFKHYRWETVSRELISEYKTVAKEGVIYNARK